MSDLQTRLANPARPLLDKLIGALVFVFGDCLRNGERMAAACYIPNSANGE